MAARFKPVFRKMLGAVAGRPAHLVDSYRQAGSNKLWTSRAVCSARQTIHSLSSTSPARYTAVVSRIKLNKNKRLSRLPPDFDRYKHYHCF